MKGREIIFFLTMYTLFLFFVYLSVFFVSASSLLKQAINAFWSVKEATQKKKIQVLPIVVEPMTSWPQLFIQGIALSTGLVTIQRISISKKPIALSA